MAPVSVAVDLLVALLNNAIQISQLIQQAQASGQTHLTQEQWTTILEADNAAQASMIIAIEAAKAAGR